jgi:hypothetical protein
MGGVNWGAGLYGAFIPGDRNNKAHHLFNDGLFVGYYITSLIIY